MLRAKPLKTRIEIALDQIRDKLVINLKTAKAMLAGAPHKRGKIVLEGNG